MGGAVCIQEISRMEESKGLSGIFGQFKKIFWIVNTLELFERGAYYGTMAVLGVHVVETILGGGHNAEAIWGALYAMLIILLYFIPLVSAALAEKYGYRLVLLGAFGILIIGYFLLFFVKPYQLTFLIFGLILLGIGAGAFKPIISASIAHVTLDAQRNLAYSIYYWMINLGAFMFPLMIGFIFPTVQLFHFVFLISTVLIGINLAISFFLYEDPIESQKLLSIGKAINRILPALKDKKFAILLLIYSGFWFMFAYNHTFLPIYMVQFKRMPLWFVVAWLATINPGTIIILGPFLGKLIEKYKSLNVMMTGILIFCLGLIINGFSNSSELFVLGIIIFSIGEFITHPGFISYVSKIAPKDMVAIYMGCIFISTGLGNAVGGAVQGVWYSYFARSLSMPKIYISLVIAVGLLTLICFIIYNRWMISERLKTEPSAKVDTGLWTKPITAGVVLLFIPVTIYGAYLGGTNMFYGDEETQEYFIPLSDFEEFPYELDEIHGSANENSQTQEIIDITHPNIKEIIFTLTWRDEEDSSYRHNNMPDEFELSVKPPEGSELTSEPTENPRNGEGEIVIVVDIEGIFTPEKAPFLNGTGQYNVTILCNVCGDQEPTIPDIINLRTETDSRNDWFLEVTYIYYREPYY